MFKAPTKWLLKGPYLYASFRFPAIRFDAPTLLSFSGCTHAHAKCPPVSLMNMFGIGQCKTRTTDYCFSTCKWERDNNSPTVSHLKNNGSQSLRSLHFKLPRLVFYAWVYAFITPGDAQIKFEASFLQKQNQRRLTDFTKALLLFRFLEISRLAMVNGHLH